jgi:hypothetical protein
LINITGNRFLAVLFLLVFFIIGLSLDTGWLKTGLMVFTAKAAVTLWFLVGIKKLLKAFNKWRLKNGLLFHHEARREWGI